MDPLVNLRSLVNDLLLSEKISVEDHVTMLREFIKLEALKMRLRKEGWRAARLSSHPSGGELAADWIHANDKFDDVNWSEFEESDDEEKENETKR